MHKRERDKEKKEKGKIRMLVWMHFSLLVVGQVVCTDENWVKIIG